MRVTLKDVAREAGVSVTTASRALNGKGELAAESRALVMEVAERLHYVPSDVARALVSGRSNTLGVMFTDITHPVYADLLAGVEDEANNNGMSVLYMNSGEDHEMAARCMRTLRSKHVDGVLFTPLLTDSGKGIEELSSLGVPLVAVLRAFPEVPMDYVIADNEESGYLATRHLIELGHRRIAHIGGLEGASTTDGRAAGYERALRESRIKPQPNMISRGPHSNDEGHRVASELLSRDKAPTAIFASTFGQALGTLQAAREAGARIPDDIALVAGDETDFAQYLEPPLTTVRQPTREMGRQGAKLMLARLAGRRRRPKGIVLHPELIVRRSSGDRVSRATAR
jgi:LacI family transcriptional regulator